MKKVISLIFTASIFVSLLSGFSKQFYYGINGKVYSENANILNNGLTLSGGEETMTEEEKFELLQQEIASRIHVASVNATWGPATSGFENTGFTYAYRYTKGSGIGADVTKLSINSQDIKSLSFDVFVASTNADANGLEFQLDGGASFACAKDSNGTDLEVSGTTMPVVKLKQNGTYSIKLDLTNSADTAFIKHYTSRSVDLYYSNFVFEYNTAEDEELALLKQEIASRINVASVNATWGPATSGFENTGFTYAYRYTKGSGIGADVTKLSINSQDIKSLSFDVFVASTNADANGLEFQLDGGASFACAKDSNGTDLEVSGTTMPVVKLKQNGTYSIKLDLTNSADTAFIKHYASRSVDLYYSNFVFEYNTAEDEELALLKQEIASRINVASVNATWGPATSGFENTGFTYAYRYTKGSGIGADVTKLSINSQDIKSLSFDVFVASTNADANGLEFQLDGGASFACAKDSNGTDLEVSGTTMPVVKLKQNGTYSIKLDLTNSADTAFIKHYASRSVDLYYSNFVFEYGYKPASISYTQSVIYKSQADFSYFAWPSVTSLGGSRLIAVASGYRESHRCPYGKEVGWISEDNGATWGEPFVIADTPLDDRDAGVIYWQGKIIVTWFTAPVRNYASGSAAWQEYCSTITPEQEARYLGANFTVSEDGGLTWSEPELMPVFSPHGMIEGPNGELVYVGYSHYDNEQGRFTKIGMITSTDGVNWSDVKIIADTPVKDQYGFDEPHAVFADDGTLIVQLRTTNDGIYQCESQDYGESFTDFHLICDAGDTPPNLLKLGDGTLILTYGCRTAPFGIRTKLSYDNGVTWTNDRIITTDGFEMDMGYPDTVALSNGKLLTVYYQRQYTSDLYPGIMQIVWDVPQKPISETMTISFDSQGGSNVEAISGLFGTTAIRPADPTREGYTFDGWYTDLACEQKYTFSIFSDNVTLYAKWQTDFIVTVSNGEATITNYNSDIDGSLAIPESLDGNTVVAVADGAFSAQSGLKTIYIPAGVKRISATAFDGCNALTTINYNGTVAGWKLVENAIGKNIRINYLAEVIGDLNDDNDVNATDLTYMFDYILKGGELTDVQSYIFDANLDGKVNLIDLVRMKGYIAGKADIFGHKTVAETQEAVYNVMSFNTPNSANVSTVTLSAPETRDIKIYDQSELLE